MQAKSKLDVAQLENKLSLGAKDLAKLCTAFILYKYKTVRRYKMKLKIQEDKQL